MSERGCIWCDASAAKIRAIASSNMRFCTLCGRVQLRDMEMIDSDILHYADKTGRLVSEVKADLALDKYESDDQIEKLNLAREHLQTAESLLRDAAKT